MADEPERKHIYLDGEYHPAISRVFFEHMSQTPVIAWPALFNYLLTPGDHEAALDAMVEDLGFTEREGGDAAARRRAEALLAPVRAQWVERGAEAHAFMLEQAKEAGTTLAQALDEESYRASRAHELFE